jgi:hypothetical protein
VKGYAHFKDVRRLLPTEINGERFLQIIVWSVLLLISIVCADPGPEIPDGRRQKKPLSGGNTGSGNALTKSNSSGQKTTPLSTNVKNDEKIPPSVFVQTPPPVQTLHPNIPVPVLPSFGPQGIFMTMGNPGNVQNQFMNGENSSCSASILVF